MFQLDKKKRIIILALIFILAVFFRFYNLTDNDVAGDDALYSMRALGWFDYLGGGQTTPFQWFGHIPWWANLSFHDAPPLVFAIQNIFFRIFGPTTFGARLPFALASFGVVLLVYFILKLKDEKTALLAGFLMAIFSFGIWISRTGYLEGTQIFFITLSILFFARYLAKRRQRDMFFWGIAVGLSLLGKYTALFLLPAAGLYFLIWQRSMFKRKEFWLSLVLMALVLTPVIIYNIQVWQTRGHFDAALSSMLGMHPEDFKTISGRTINTAYLRNFLGIGNTISSFASLPLFLLIISSLIYLLIKIIRRKSSKLENFIGVNILMASIMFLFLGVSGRYVSIIVPLIVMVLALFIQDIWRLLRVRDFFTIQKIMAVILAVVFLGEILYSVNTNIAKQPVGEPPLTHSVSRFYNQGFNQLDDYLREEILVSLPPLRRIKSKDDFMIRLDQQAGKDIILVDETMSWFAYSWYIEKYSLFYQVPIVSFNKLLPIMPVNSNPLEELSKLNLRGVYYIYVTDRSVLDGVKKENKTMMYNMNLMARLLEKNKAEVKEIKNFQGLTVFKIYHLAF